MNTLKILFISFLFTLPALAEENVTPSLTLAAAETTRSTFWANEAMEAKAKTLARTYTDFEVKALKLGDKISADLGKALEEKFNRELNL